MEAVALRNQAISGYRTQLLNIENIDLSKIRNRLIEKSGWEPSKCSEVEVRYKAFLCLAALNRDGQLVPPHDVDEMWHVHILHTKKYAKDCQDYLGFFLHHRPDDKKGQTTQAARDFTAQLFASVGLPYLAPAECSGDTSCSQCSPLISAAA